MIPEDFPRHFSAAFASQDADALAAMFLPDATLQSLTGLWAESPEEIRDGFATEAAGIFRAARLVTGKGTLRDLGPHAMLLRQRYMISGAQDQSGAELPRFAAMLVAVMEKNDGAWLVQSLTFTVLT